MSVFVNRREDGRVRLAGGRPGWTVTWLGLAEVLVGL